MDEAVVRQQIQAISDLLSKRGLTLSVAESCTGGLLAKYLTDLPGASNFFMGGVITYSNRAKTDVIAVPKALIDKFGAVSKEVAEAMASGVRTALKSDLALSITGLAGPDGGSAEKPVGTFWVGLATQNGVDASNHFYPGERSAIRIFAAYTALQKLSVSLANKGGHRGNPR